MPHRTFVELLEPEHNAGGLTKLMLWRKRASPPSMHRNCRPLRAGSEQHRQCTAEHVVDENDVGWEVPEELLQALILSWDWIEERARHEGLKQVLGDFPADIIL